MPVRVLGGAQGGEYLAGVSQIATADGEDSAFTCVVMTDGTVYCWGCNYDGQLGNNSTTRSLVPVQVLGGAQGGMYLMNVSQVSIATGTPGSGAQEPHVCALTVGGEVFCWGHGSYGELGENSSSSSRIPVKVVGGEQEGKAYLSNIIQVSVGATAFNGFSCALTSSGEVYCWGSNGYGQLGNGESGIDLKSVSPVKVVGGEQEGVYLSNIVQISAGSSFVCAVAMDGAVYCWGYNYSGQLGNNSTTSSSVPIKVLGGAQETTYLSNVIQMSCSGSWGYAHTCSVISNGEIYCWGSNSNGQLGNNTTTDSLIPVKVYDGTGIPPCINSCCSHWNYENIGEICSTNETYGCYIAAGEYSVICPVPTPTPTSTYTVIYTPSNTFTETYTSSITLTKTNTPSNKQTKTYTHTLSNTLTATYTPSNTFYNTFTKTLTPLETATSTYTITNTSTMLGGYKIVTPITQIKKPTASKNEKNNIKVILEDFDGGSLQNNPKKPDAEYKYLIHVRKLKRLGHKDKNYRLGRKKLKIRKSNKYTIKNPDVGIYSLRYRIIITKNNVVKRTKWTGRNLVVF